MMLGFFKLKVTAGIENKGTGSCGMFNQSNQLTQFGHFSYLVPPNQQ
jgi:hypothetical protein